MQRLQNTSRYPTSLIIKGADPLGIEIAKSLLEQGGYVIIVDNDNEETIAALANLKQYKLVTLLDYSAIASLEDELRRLDYVFYLHHQTNNYEERVATQEFLQFSNYLDTVLDLSVKFESKFLLSTSVKAHQMILASKQIDINFNPEVEEKHTIYTELEIQRYAESLVKEYQEKVGIDARILRLGELIGRGIEINPESKLIKMILEGLESRYLTIPGDGLESDYYVHFLDAAYGVLKAQFSQSTKGKIFTLANEEEITILSVGYKLMEVFSEPKEIRFRQDDNSLPPLKLYKSADNLEKIGWKPRVNFERALAQTVDYVNEVVKNTKDTGTPDEQDNHINKGIAQRLKGIFGKEENSVENLVEDQPEHIEGAIARLIAERKMQEKARKGSIILANSTLRERLKPEKELNALQRLNERVTQQFDKLKYRFNFLKKITLFDFVFASIGLAAFLVLYFLLIAPSISLVKNYFLISSNLSDLNTALQNFDFVQANIHDQNIKTNLVEAQGTIEDLQYVFDTFGKHQLYLDTQTLMSSLIEYSSGVNELLTAFEPLAEYIQTVNPNLQYTFNSDNLLVVGNNKDYQTLLQDLRNNSRLISIGSAKIEKSQSDILTYLEKQPDFIKSRFSADLNKTSELISESDFFRKSYAFLPSLLAQNELRNYLFVIQDNTRYSSGGGQVVGFVNFEMQNGAITSVNLLASEELENRVKSLTLDDQLLAQLNLLTTKDVTRENIDFYDLSKISDKRIFLNTMQELYQMETGKQIDIALSVNMSFLETLLKQSGNVEYQQIQVSSDNILNSINLLLGDNKSSARRNEIIINLFALSISREINNFKNNAPRLISAIGAAYQNGDLAYEVQDNDLKTFFSTLATPNNVNDTIFIGANSKSELIQANKYGIVNVNVKVTVNADLSTSKVIELETAGLDSIENSFVCLPNGSSGITYQDIDITLVTTTFSQNQICAIFLPDNNLKYGMQLRSVSFADSVQSMYNYSFRVEKAQGIDANYNVEFVFDSSLQVTPQEKEYINQDNTFINAGILDESTKTFSFNISKT